MGADRRARPPTLSPPTPWAGKGVKGPASTAAHQAWRNGKPDTKKVGRRPRLR